MTILAKVYAGSVTTDPLISTLEIQTPERIYICDQFENLTFTTEDGDREFVGSAMAVELPKRDNTGSQELTFAIENVTGIAQREIDSVIESGDPVNVIYRAYLASDPSEPAEPPLKLVLVSSTSQGAQIEITCSHQDPINTAWPRRIYTASFAPGLVYFR